MTPNIENIRLWNYELDGDVKAYNKVKPVKIIFKFPCSWTTLSLEDLKKLLRLWIKGEEEVYLLNKGYEGRWMLFNEIKKVFNEGLKDKRSSPDIDLINPGIE